MRVVTWNMNRAAARRSSWDYLLTLAPDIALLQEFTELPAEVRAHFQVREQRPITKSDKPQRFCNAILVRGSLVRDLSQCLEGLGGSRNGSIQIESLCASSHTARRQPLQRALRLQPSMASCTRPPAWERHRRHSTHPKQTGVGHRSSLGCTQNRTEKHEWPVDRGR